MKDCGAVGDGEDDLARCLVDGGLRGAEPGESSASGRGSWPGRACSSSRSPPASAVSCPGVPAARTVPWPMMTTVVASRSASSMYWVVSRTLAPPAASLPEDLPQLQPPRGSSPVVGSSRNRTGAWLTWRRRGPGGGASPRNTSGPAARPRRPAPADRSAPGAAARAAAGQAGRRPIMTRFSRPVRNGSTAAYCPDRPIRRRTAAGFWATSIPATRARPSSGLEQGGQDPAPGSSCRRRSA